MVEGARDYYRRWRDREEEGERLLPLPAPGKRSLIEKMYGHGVAPVSAVLEAASTAQLEEAAESPERARAPVPAAGPPLLPAEVGQYLQAKQAKRAAPRAVEYRQAVQPRPAPPPEPEDGEAVAHRARRPVETPAREPAPVHANTPAPANAPPPANAARLEQPGDPVRRVLEDFEAGHERPEGEVEEEAEEVDIPEDLEGLGEEELDDLADDLDLELPADATAEQKRRAIEAARAARQGRALKGVARLAKKVAADAAADKTAIEKKGKGKATGRAAQGKAAAGAAKAANAVRTFAKAKNIDELKARLRKVMEEDKARFDTELKKQTEELGTKMKAERTRVGDELKTLETRLASEIAAKEKEIAGQIQQKLADAKSRAEVDRGRAQATTEAEKKRRRDQAAVEARRLESEGDTQGAAAARSQGEGAARELDGKLAVTLENIGKAERDGATKLEAEKETMLTEARAKAKTAGEEARAKHDAAIVKINEDEREAAEKLKQANEALRKGAIEKFDAQMKKLESGKAEDLAKLEAETNKVIGEIDLEVLRFQAAAQAQTRAAVQATAKEAAAAVEAIKQDGAKASAAIDDIAAKAMARVDQQAAEMAARQAAVADEGQRRLTADTPEEAAQVEREAEAREKAEREKVEAEESARKAEEEAIDKAAAEMADELDDTFVDEEAVLAHMRGKTPEQVAAIKEAYFKKTGRKLDGDLVAADALDEKELKEAKAHLSGDPVQRAVATLENAEDGWTGEEDEQRIKETLAKLDPETRKRVAAEYEKQTGRRLSAMVEDELDAEDAKATALPAEEPKAKVEGVDQAKKDPRVTAAEAAIYGATAGRMGTNEKAIVEALKGKTPAEIEAIKQIWLDNHGPPGLDAILEDELSGTDLKEAKALMSDDPVRQAVASLHNATDGLGTDVDKVQATLESIKDPVLRAQVAAQFEKETGQSLDGMLKDELSGRDRDKAEAAAAGDEAGLRAIKFDEAKNSTILGELSDSVADTLGVDRETMRTITDVAAIVAVVATGPFALVYGAALMAEEHIDLHDDENAMYRALEECKTREERKAMEEAFNRRYAPKTLRGEISTLDGAEKDVAAALLDGKKTEARAAKMKAGSEQFGWADKELMFQALKECESKEERDALIAEYNRRYGAAAGGVDYQAMLDETFEHNDLDREKARQLTDDGKMDDAFAYYYAMNAGWGGSAGFGWGTDHAEMERILKGKTPEQIKKLNEDLKKVGSRYGDDDVDLFADTADETSGREGKRLEMALRGAPTTMEEALKRQKEMAAFERDDVGGWAVDAVVLVLAGPLYAPLWLAARAAGLDTDDVARGAVDSWSDAGAELAASQARLKAAAAEIDRTTKRLPGESQAEFEKRKLELFNREAAREEGYLKNYQEAKDETAEGAQTAVSLAVTAGLSVATGGSFAWVAALAGGLTGVAAKAAIAGGSYSNEELAMDLLEVAAEAAAAFAAKGLKLDDALEGLKKLGVADQLITRILKEACEEAVENGVSELILALFDPSNYDSPEAFLLGVTRAVGQAALSGAMAAVVTVALGDVYDKFIGDPGSNKLKAFIKGAVTEGVAGFAAAAVDPATWEGNLEEVLTRFGMGFIDNILSAGAEGIGEGIDTADRRRRLDRTRAKLASQGVTNTKVVSGMVVDFDSGRVFGSDGVELGKIAIDPNTGAVTDVTDPSNPIPIGTNPNLKGVGVGGIDTNAQAGAAPAGPSSAEPEGDRPTIELRPGPSQAEIDQATAQREAHEQAAHQAAAVEKARAVLATMSGETRAGRSREVATAIASELLMKAGVVAELHSAGSHFFLKIGETIIDGALHEFFTTPDGFAPAVFIGSPDALKAVVTALERNVGLDPAVAGDRTGEQLFAAVWAGGSAVAPVATTGEAREVASDFPILADSSSLHPDVGFGSHQQARAQAALAGMSDTEYARMRALVDAQQNDAARAYLLKALAAGNSLAEIERFALKIHGQPEGWLLANLSLADPLGLPGGGIPQQSQDSCNASMLIAMMGDLDPILALRVRENPNAIDLIARLERQMLETRYQGINHKAGLGDKGVAVPREFAEGRGRGRFIDDFLNAQSKWTGISFQPEMDPTATRVIAVLDQSLDAGMDVPVVVGPAAKVYAHYVLVTGRRVDAAGFAEYRFFDPGTGRSQWVKAADIIGGRVGVAGFSLITGIEVPSAAAGAAAVSTAVDGEADVEAAPAPGTAGGTPNVDAVLNGAGAMTERVRQMLGRMSAGGLGALERIAGHALGDSPQVEGLVPWVQHTTKHTRKLVGDELTRRMGDAEAELYAALRLLAEAPGSTILMGGDRAAERGPTGGRMKSSDLLVIRPDGSRARVEVTRLATPLAAVEQIDKPFLHGIKEDNLPAGTRREVSIEIALDPAAPASLLDDLAAHLGTVADNQKLDRMTLVDQNGAPIADFERAAGGWTRVAVTMAPAVAPGAAAPLPLFDLRRQLGLLTAGEQAQILADQQLEAAGRRTGDPAVIVSTANVLVNLPPLTSDEAIVLMRQLADGNSHGLRARGIAIPLDFDSKQKEWGMALLHSGDFGIVRGDTGGVDQRRIPEVLSLVGHSHPLTADRQIDTPTHVSDLLIGDLQFLLHPSGRFQDLTVARGQTNHTIFLPYQHLGGGMIGQTVDNAPDQPHNGLDILRPPGIEVVLVTGPRIVGVHHTDAQANPHPVFVVTIQIQAGSDVLYRADFGVFVNSQYTAERVTELGRMPDMVPNAAAEHAANMQARGLGEQVGPIDGIEVWSAGPNTPLGFSVPDRARAETALARIASGDPRGLEDIGMFPEGLSSTPTDIVYALAQLRTGAFVIVRGGRDGVVLPPWLTEVSRTGGSPPPAASPSPAPVPAAAPGDQWTSGGAALSPGAGWQIG